MDKIYFDHNSTIALRKEIRDYIYNFQLLPYNPSSVHYYGREAKKILNEAREKLLEIINGKDKYKIIFTSSATESNHLILNNFLGKTIFFSPIEHSSIINNIIFKSNLLKIDLNGEINTKFYEEKLSSAKDKGLVTIMLANNETGLIQNIKLLSEIAHKYGFLFHTDATQAFGKIIVDIIELDVDFMTISSHKIGGPAGVASLIYRSDYKLQALLKGGGQEYGIRAGTENVISISAFAEAAILAINELSLFQNHTSYLRNYLENEIGKISSNTIFFAKNSNRLSNISNFNMPDISAETQIINFDLANIMVSSGSACASGKVKNSHVLEGMGYDESISSTAIRASFGLINNIEEIDYFIKKWHELYIKIVNQKKIA